VRFLISSKYKKNWDARQKKIKPNVLKISKSPVRRPKGSILLFTVKPREGKKNSGTTKKTEGCHVTNVWLRERKCAK